MCLCYAPNEIQDKLININVQPCTLGANRDIRYQTLRLRGKGQFPQQ